MEQVKCMFENGQEEFTINDDMETRLEYSKLKSNECLGNLEK